MLIINRKLYQNGFSLIELMVAITILVMAIFGIFHAYSVGFMGMADARARTVATNYAREAMEDIKNMDFGEIKPQGSSVTVNGITYNRQVIVQENTNIKRVITTVTWKDRNLNTKMVEADMLVHFIETTAGDPTRIMLIAKPYNILTEDYDDTIGVYENESIITAVVKDAKGNTVTTYNGEITFSITVGDTYGSLQNNSNTYTVSSIKGIATTTFTASSKGEVIITASANGLADDSVTIKITDPGEAVKINLTNYVEETETLFMTPGTVSTITATIVDAGEKTVTGATNEITFSDPSGPGTLSNQQPLTDGVVEITLTSDSTPGTITVTASSTDLEPGVVDVITGGQISLSASPTSIPVNEKSMITVTTKDIDGIPIKYNGIINLSVAGYGTTPGSGNLPFDSPCPVIFNGTTSSETLIFTALSEGQVQITATDIAGILTENTLILTIGLALVPHHIEVYANPPSIQAGGTESSTINARVKTADNVTITSYTDTIVFKTTAGLFHNESDEISIGESDVTYTDGVATVELYPPPTSGTAEIKVYSPSIEFSSITGSTEVGFYIDADHIQLIANPQHIEVISGNPNACIIIATIMDEYTNTIYGYDGKVKFSIVSGDAKFALTGSTIITVVNGEAQILLQSGNSSGTVKVKATSSYKNKEGVKIYIEGYLNIPVGVSLILADPPNIDYYSLSEPYYVSFDIDIQGADLILEEMQVYWDVGDPAENLEKIDIAGVTIYDYDNDPSNPVGSIVYTDNSNERVADIDVADTTLSTGTSTIVMYFSGDIYGKTTLDVTFNPNSGNYTVNLIE